MMLTVKEMELLCIFHDGTLSSTLDLLRHAETESAAPPNRGAVLRSLIEKLAAVETGSTVSITFEPEK